MPGNSVSGAISGAISGAAPQVPRRAPQRLRRWPARLLLALAAVLLLSAGWGLRDPWPPDEPRFVLAAMGMLEGQGWLIPRFAGLPYADKPPLFMWSQAGAIAATGSLRLGFLLPSLLAGLLVLLLVWDLGRRLWNERAGLAAAWLLLLSVQFIDQARFAQIDMLLCACTTLGLYGLLRHFLLGPAWYWYGLAGVAMGLGIIAKGVGFLPLLLFLPFLLARYSGCPGAGRPFGDPWRWTWMPRLLVVTVAAWLVPMLILTGAQAEPALQDYRQEILFGQTIQRYVDAPHHHRHGAYFFTQVIPVMWLPLVLLLPWLIPAWGRRLWRGDARYVLLLGWVLLLLLFFSFSSGKRGVYIFPALPALALAAGPLCAALLRRRRLGGLATLLSWGLLLGGLGAAALWPWREELVADLFPLPWWLGLFPWALGLGAALLLRCTAKQWPRRPLALAGLLWAAGLGLGWLLPPAMDEQRSGRLLMQEVAQQLPPEAQLGLVDWREQFLLWAPPQTRVFAHRSRHHDDLAEEIFAALHWLNDDPKRWLMGPVQLFYAPGAAAEDQPFRAFEAIHLGLHHREHWTLINRRHFSRMLRQHLRDHPQAQEEGE